MVFKSFREKFNAGIEKAFKAQYGVEEEQQTPMQKSMKAWLPGYKSYNRYGQNKTTVARQLAPQAARLMYQYNVIVRVAVDTIINEVTSANWDIMPKEKDQKLDETQKAAQEKQIKEVKHFFENPNHNNENFRTILEKMMRDLLILDSGVFEKVRNKAGKISELYAIDGGTITIDADRHGTIKSYWQELNQEGIKPQQFENRNIIYLMMNPRTDSLYGMSPLESLNNIVSGFLYGETYNLKYFENSSTPRGVLDLGPNIQEDQLDRFRTYWQAENQQQPHRTFVVGGASSGTKWTPIAITPKDMEFNTYMNWLLKLILAVFGVTPSEVGWTEDVKGAPATGQLLQSQAFKNKAIYPMMDKISYYLTRDIIWDEFGFENLKFEFIEEQSLQDKMQKAQYDNIRIMSGVVTADEVRKEEGLEPLQNDGSQSPFGGPQLGEEEGNLEGEPSIDLEIEEASKDLPSAFNLLKKEVINAVDKNAQGNNKSLSKMFQQLKYEIYRALIYNKFVKDSNEKL